MPALLEPLRRGLDQSGQLPIRWIFVLIVALAVLAEVFGLDLALGALAAGMMVAFAVRGGERVHDLHAKIDAIGYGFLVPIFFVTSGMKLDVRSLVDDRRQLVVLVAVAVCLLVVRLPLVLMARKAMGARRALALGLLSATTLSLIVVLTQVAFAAGAMTAAEAAPLVGAGIVSVILFPSLGLRLSGASPVLKRTAEDRDGL